MYVAYRIIGVAVDSDGFLREPLFCIPVGYLSLTGWDDRIAGFGDRALSPQLRAKDTRAMSDHALRTCSYRSRLAKPLDLFHIQAERLPDRFIVLTKLWRRIGDRRRVAVDLDAGGHQANVSADRRHAGKVG